MDLVLSGRKKGGVLYGTCECWHCFNSLKVVILEYVYKGMKTGQGHSQHFYEINISIEKLFGKVLYSHVTVTELVTLGLA